MLGNSSGYWSPGSDFEDVEVLWPEPKRSASKFANFNGFVMVV